MGLGSFMRDMYSGDLSRAVSSTLSRRVWAAADQLLRYM